MVEIRGDGEEINYSQGDEKGSEGKKKRGEGERKGKEEIREKIQKEKDVEKMRV